MGHGPEPVTYSRAIARPKPVFESKCTKVGPVTFPAFTGERIYMMPFLNGREHPGLERWQKTIAAMLKGIPVGVLCYLMVDQSTVEPGQPQRRPGVHVDGNWTAESGWTIGGGLWKELQDVGYLPESIVLASNIEGCVGYTGVFEGRPGPGGNCSHIDISGGQKVALKPNLAYRGNVTFLHESTPILKGGKCTLVRINVPGIEP